jgi:hypothetical protein
MIFAVFLHCILKTLGDPFTMQKLIFRYMFQAKKCSKLAKIYGKKFEPILAIFFIFSQNHQKNRPKSLNVPLSFCRKSLFLVELIKV